MFKTPYTITIPIWPPKRRDMYVCVTEHKVMPSPSEKLHTWHLKCIQAGWHAQRVVYAIIYECSLRASACPHFPSHVPCECVSTRLSLFGIMPLTHSAPTKPLARLLASTLIEIHEHRTHAYMLGIQNGAGWYLWGGGPALRHEGMGEGGRVGGV